MVMTNLYTKYKVPGPSHSSVIERKPFFSSRSLWPWPLTSKSIAVMTNLHTKYEVCGPKCSSVIERKPFFNSRSSWPYPDFDLLTSKSIWIMFLSWQTWIPRLRFTGQSDLQLLGRNHFLAQGQRDLDLCYTDLKINRDHLLVMTNLHARIDLLNSKSIGIFHWAWPTCKPSMVFLGPSPVPWNIVEIIMKKINSVMAQVECFSANALIGITWPINAILSLK